MHAMDVEAQGVEVFLSISKLFRRFETFLL
jgi:hypothetical protein